MKYKKLLITITMIVIFIFGIMLLTSYAWYSLSGGSTAFDTNTYNEYIEVSYETNEYINISNAIPIDNSEIEEKSNKNIFDVTITNPDKVAEVLLSISLIDIKINDTLKNNDFKYQLLHNGNIISSGTGIDFTSDTLELTSKEVAYSTRNNNFIFRIWLNDNGQEQNELQNSTFSCSILVKAVKVRNKASDNMVIDYEYTKNYQTFIAPYDGLYKVELWGASGGDINEYKGGKGAYTSGYISLTKGEKFYIYVGGAGNNTEKGGYNGGGDLREGENKYGSSGGGATDIRLTSGNWDDFDGLKSRIMVAAGGGGANDRNGPTPKQMYGAGNGGSGGTLVGKSGQSVNYKSTSTTTSYNSHGIGGGGSQNEGGYAYSYNENDELLKSTKLSDFGTTVPSQSGGGGGYYNGSPSSHGGAGGGSSFISGYDGCDAITENSTQGNITHTKQSIHYSNYKFENGIMISGDSEMPNYNSGNMQGNTGNGHARITYIYDETNQKIAEYKKTDDYQTFTAPYDGVYKVELWGASGGDIHEYKGGKGAYTTGNISLKKDEKLYIYVGGAGSNTDNGGYNGGGDLIEGQNIYGSSGGGATDVRLKSGNWDDFESLKSRIMVAAGGGGANDRNGPTPKQMFGAGNGGSGGTLVGKSGQSVNYKSTSTTTSYDSHGIGGGGNQNEGGYAYYYNENDELLSSRKTSDFGTAVELNQSGGGGGYYNGSPSSHGGAGGGSSFISGYDGCDAIAENSTQGNITHTKQSVHYSKYKFNDGIMISGDSEMPNYNGGNMQGNIGDGYARITLIENKENINLTFDYNYNNDINNWQYLNKSQFTSTYNEESKMNTISITTASNKWEEIFLPISTIPNKEYIVTFDYEIITPYNTINSDSKGIGYQIIQSSPIADNLDQSIVTKYLPTSVSNDIRHASIEFKAKNNTSYFVFNFGSVEEDVNLKCKIGNIKVRDKNTKSVTKETKIGELVEPNILNYQFEGWYTDPKGGKKITENSTVPAKNTTYYAHWKESNNVIFYGNNGTIANGSVLTNSLSNSGFETSTLSHLIYSDTIKLERNNTIKYSGDYSLKASIPLSSTNQSIRDTTHINKNHVYYAREMVNLNNIHNPLSGEFDLFRVGGSIEGYPEYLNIKFNTITESNKWHQLSGVFTSTVDCDYYYRIGYFSSTTPGSIEIYFDDLMMVDVTFTYINGQLLNIIPYFEGDQSILIKGVAYNSEYGTLPIPTRTGYTFEGWYTDETGGTKINEKSIKTTNKDQILYAHWTKS